MEQRIQREKEFHNEEVIRRSRASVRKFYSITRASRKFYEEILLSNCQNKRVLDYGCGSGSHTIWLAKHGAIATGIDISDVRIIGYKIELSKPKKKPSKKGYQIYVFLS